MPSTPRSQIRTSRPLRNAFTLIELLVVVTIIIVLVAILLPGIKRAADGAQVAVCVSNQRQISVAWVSYSADNAGVMPGSFGSTQPHSWIQDGNSAAAITQGTLWPYLGSMGVYLCPVDPRGYLRSYSVSNYIGGQYGWDGVLPISRMAVVPKPGICMLTIEEPDYRGYNQGSWVMYVTQDRWIDWPSAWHYGNGNVTSFIDGHASFYMFQDPSTQFVGDFNTPAPNNPDLRYYQKIYYPI